MNEEREHQREEFRKAQADLKQERIEKVEQVNDWTLITVQMLKCDKPDCECNGDFPLNHEPSKGRAKMRDVRFYRTAIGEIALGILLEHTQRDFIRTGHIWRTTKITVKHPNGDFETMNTYYEVVK